jgi:hypothetical protein
MRGTGYPADKVGADPVLPRIHVYCAAKTWMAGPSQAKAKPGHDEFSLGKCSNRRVGGTGLANICANI